MTFRELDAEFDEDSQRIWKFICEQVIFRDSMILNKHQITVKKRAYNNIQTAKATKIAKEIAAKESFKAQLKRNESLLLGTGGLHIDREELLYQKKLNEF